MAREVFDNVTPGEDSLFTMANKLNDNFTQLYGFEASFEFTTNETQRWYTDLPVTLTSRRQINGTADITVVVKQPMLAHHSDVSNANWVKENVTTATNAVTDPDGTTLADSLTGTGTGTRRIYDLIVQDASNRTFSFGGFLRGDTAHTGSLRMLQFTSGFSVLDTLSTAQSIATTWQYHEISKTYGALASAANTTVELHPDTSGSTNHITYFYNLQLYEHKTITSYPYSVPAGSIILVTSTNVVGNPLFLLKGSFA